MTGLDAGTGDGARPAPPVILPFDVAARPRYASASSPWPGETDAAAEVSGQLVQKPQGGRPETPPLVDRIVEHFANLPDGGGDLGMEIAGAIAEAGDDKRARARALCERASAANIARTRNSRRSSGESASVILPLGILV